jgi:hypothetical protein
MSSSAAGSGNSTERNHSSTGDSPRLSAATSPINSAASSTQIITTAISSSSKPSLPSLAVFHNNSNRGFISSITEQSINSDCNSAANSSGSNTTSHSRKNSQEYNYAVSEALSQAKKKFDRYARKAAEYQQKILQLEALEQVNNVNNLSSTTSNQSMPASPTNSNRLSTSSLCPSPMVHSTTSATNYSPNQSPLLSGPPLPPLTAADPTSRSSSLSLTFPENAAFPGLSSNNHRLSVSIEPSNNRRKSSLGSTAPLLSTLNKGPASAIPPHTVPINCSYEQPSPIDLERPKSATRSSSSNSNSGRSRMNLAPLQKSLLSEINHSSVAIVDPHSAGLEPRSAGIYPSNYTPHNTINANPVSPNLLRAGNRTPQRSRKPTNIVEARTSQLNSSRNDSPSTQTGKYPPLTALLDLADPDSIALSKHLGSTASISRKFPLINPARARSNSVPHIYAANFLQNFRATVRPTAIDEDEGENHNNGSKPSNSDNPNSQNYGGMNAQQGVDETNSTQFSAFDIEINDLPLAQRKIKQKVGSSPSTTADTPVSSNSNSNISSPSHSIVNFSKGAVGLNNALGLSSTPEALSPSSVYLANHHSNLSSTTSSQSTSIIQSTRTLSSSSSTTSVSSPHYGIQAKSAAVPVLAKVVITAEDSIHDITDIFSPRNEFEEAQSAIFD